jgi:hypothetical protein
MCDCLTKWFFNLQNLPYTIVNDKYLYTQEEGDILKKQYNLKIKGKETLKLTVRPNGDIVSDKKQSIKKGNQNFWLPFISS